LNTNLDSTQPAPQNLLYSPKTRVRRPATLCRTAKIHNRDSTHPLRGALWCFADEQDTASTTGSGAPRSYLVSSPACSRRAGRCRWCCNPAQWI